MSSINNPDLSNTEPEYWEMILKNHDLSMDRGARIGLEEIIPAGLMGLNGEEDEETDYEQ